MEIHGNLWRLLEIQLLPTYENKSPVETGGAIAVVCRGPGFALDDSSFKDQDSSWEMANNLPTKPAI